MDVDAEMADNTQETAAEGSSTQRNNPEASSGTLDNEFTQSETQPTATTSAGAQQNRKDITLREFLSKMDDYAPIVSLIRLSMIIAPLQRATRL